MNMIKRISAKIILRLFGWSLSDEQYLKVLFFATMGYPLSLTNPVTLNEKLQWLKLYDRNSKYTQLVDKISVKHWVAEKIGEEYIIPTYKIWNKAEDIDMSDLPDAFVLKTNHGCSTNGVYVVKNKNNFNIQEAKGKLSRLLKENVYPHTKEWPYKNIESKVFAEKSLGENIQDFKFFCFDGYAESVMVCYERETGSPKFYFFDENWELKRYNVRGKNAPEGFTMPSPQNYKKMFEIASTLSKGFPFVRVDLYNVDGKIYFGEMTFYPSSGLDPNILPEVDKYMGSLINLPNKK